MENSESSLISKEDGLFTLVNKHFNTVPHTVTKSVLQVLTKIVSDGWSWTRNTRCKYITIKIDTRGHSCRIFDRDDKEITLEQLQYQLKLVEESQNHDKRFKKQKV